MHQVFKIPVIIAGTEFHIQVDKYTSVLSTDFVLTIDDAVLADLTGVRLCIFHYEPDDKEFQCHQVSYRQRKTDMLLPNVAFEMAITTAIRAHEQPNVKPTYYCSIC